MEEKLHFGRDAVAELRGLGISDAVIHVLEEVALPYVKATTIRVPMKDSKRIIPKIEKKASEISMLLDELQGDPPAIRLARHLMREAASRHAADVGHQTGKESSPLDLEKLSCQIKELAEVAGDAAAKLKGKQSRHREAATYPILAIESVLMGEEWGEDYVEAGKALPRYSFPVSNVDSSSFKKIVCICYQAAGHPTDVPERAIRAYVEFTRQENKWLDDLVGQ